MPFETAPDPIFPFVTAEAPILSSVTAEAPILASVTAEPPIFASVTELSDNWEEPTEPAFMFAPAIPLPTFDPDIPDILPSAIVPFVILEPLIVTTFPLVSVNANLLR